MPLRILPPPALDPEDLSALKLDEEWLRQKLRMALATERRDGFQVFGGGIWRLGNAPQAPVLLARHLKILWQDPHLIDRAGIVIAESD